MYIPAYRPIKTSIVADVPTPNQEAKDILLTVSRILSTAVRRVELASTQVEALKLSIEDTKLLMENVKTLLTTLNAKTKVEAVDVADIEAATLELNNNTAALREVVAAITV